MTTKPTVTRIETAGEIYPGTTRFYAHTVDAAGKAGVKVFHGTRTGTKCGARCQNSLGPSCDCSCGGHNHGRALFGVTS